MEAVGNAQSEAEATATTAEAAPTFNDFLSDDEFDDIFAAADKERDVTSSPEVATDEQKEERQERASEREQNREKTIEQLVAHFGSQEFKYTEKYRGTVMQMVAMCPAIDAVLNEGFEHVRDWLEPHKVTEEEKPKEANEDATEEPSGDDVSAKKEDEKAPVVEASDGAGVAEKTKPSNKTVAAEDKPAPVKEAVALSGNKTEEKTESVVSPEPLTADTVSMDIAIEEPAKTEGATEEIPEIEIAESQIADEVLQPEIDAGAVLNEDDSEPVLASTNETSTLERDEPEAGDETSTDTSAFYEDHTDLTQILEEELVKGPATELEPTDSFETIEPEEVAEETSSHFDAWLEIAQDEPALDDLFITIADQLEADFVQTDEAEPRTDYFAQYTVEVSDEELVLSNQPEVFAVHAAIRSARKSVEALYTARTKEECKFYIEQIVEELTIVLRSLGYDNPEVIIRAFLSSHSPESLKNLITELEASLRRAMVREIQQRRAGHAKSRHTRLSKFVGYIMQALSPSPGRAIEST